MAILSTVPRQNRQGVVITPSVVVPTGITELLVKLNVTNATYNTVGRSVTMRLYWLDDQGIWRMVGLTRWESGPYADPETGEVNPTPVLSCGLGGLTGREVRAEFEIPVSMSVGASIETLP